MRGLNPVVLERLRSWQDNPLRFVLECFKWPKGQGPTFQQKEALQAIAFRKRVSIRSGHGCGKSAAAVWIALWFMSTRAYAKVAVTGPTGRQLYDIFWAELAKWFRRSRLQDEFVMQKGKFFYKAAPEDWWIRLISPRVKATKEEQAETLAGLHGDHLLIIVDEASGVHDPVFVPLEGALTRPDNKVLLIGNMTKSSGYFYDTHFHAAIRQKWAHLHWNSEKSPLVTKETVEYFRDKYGEDSSVYAVRIKGDPPLTDERALIPLEWSRQCIGNEVAVADDEPLYLSVDIARYGDDVSVVMPRRGLKVYEWDVFKGMNTISLAGNILQTYTERNASGVILDEIGVGAGVVDWLEKHGMVNCYGVNVCWRSSDVSRYHRLRDELWWTVREKCMRGLYSFPPTKESETLCDELASPKYDFNAQGGIVVESKKKMRARGVGSPNRADALVLSEYVNSVAHKVWPVKKTHVSSNRKYYTVSGEHAWMAT